MENQIRRAGRRCSGSCAREGWTPDLVFERRPELRTLRSVDCMGETYQGRHVSLFQQLDGHDLLSVWSELGRLGVPVLVVRGEYDWICSRDEGEAIARAAGDWLGTSSCRVRDTTGSPTTASRRASNRVRAAGKARWCARFRPSRRHSLRGRRAIGRRRDDVILQRIADDIARRVGGRVCAVGDVHRGTSIDALSCAVLFIMVPSSGVCEPAFGEPCHYTPSPRRSPSQLGRRKAARGETRKRGLRRLCGAPPRAERRRRGSAPRRVVRGVCRWGTR